MNSTVSKHPQESLLWSSKSV